MRRFLFALVLLLGVYFLLTQFSEFNEIAATFQRGDWRWLGLALLVTLTWLVNVGVSLRAVYRVLGVEQNLFDMILLAVAANFLNVVAPSGGVGGMALVVGDARRRGQSGARATLASVLFLLYDYVAFLCVLALGLIVLIRRNNLTAAEITASGILVAIAVGLGAMLALGFRSAQELERALSWGVRAINRLLRPILRRDYLSIAAAHDFSADAAEALVEMRRSPASLAMPAALALSGKALLISILFLVFLAFKQPFSVGTLIAGFSISYLFLIVSPTPSGIGVVEGVMALTLRSLRVPLGSAAIITLAYRAFTFWLPLLLGFFAFRMLGREKRVSPPIDVQTPEE